MIISLILNYPTFRYYVQQCEDVFGKSFNKPNIQSGVKQTNTNYGGQDIASSKVLLITAKYSGSF